jgi:hypothetical protein
VEIFEKCNFLSFSFDDNGNTPLTFQWEITKYMFCDFYLVKNHKIGNNSTTTRAWKISTDLESLEFKTFLSVGLAKFENNQILLNKISRIFPVAPKLFTEWKILISAGIW